MRVFFDTSALAKCYVEEEGSEQVRTLCASADTLGGHLSQDAFDQAIRCLEQYPLRTLDALHVGSALVYQPDLFVSADRRQVETADLEGLAVVNLSRGSLGTKAGEDAGGPREG